MAQSDLFGAGESAHVRNHAVDPGAPLAERMRPRRLDEFHGQAHLLGEGKPLRQLIESGRARSLVLWGPPGTGKTTLGRMLADYQGARFMTLSAVLSGVRDIRAAMEQAQRHRRESGAASLLFVDEVHRFNKAQQDAFLPHVEDGTIMFVGATTENPSFELNSALLSRALSLMISRSCTTFRASSSALLTTNSVSDIPRKAAACWNRSFRSPLTRASSRSFLGNRGFGSAVVPGMMKSPSQVYGR